MRWTTREKANVDRIPCPWLIRRFVDKEAEFLYLPKDTDWKQLKDTIPRPLITHICPTNPTTNEGLKASSEYK